ncbi:MAG TPA: hypothetical protein VD905_01390 [Flavobacteriales bacterium]|nr:hypothetical protein [Flavobacteriales bacterium]
MIGKSLKIFLLFLSSTILTLVLIAFIHRYTLPYSEEGKYLNEINSVVRKEQAMAVYGTMAGVFFLLSSLLWWWVKRK